MLKQGHTLYLTEFAIKEYLKNKQNIGVSSVSITKYGSVLNHLLWGMTENTELTLPRLQEWRRKLEEQGYSKSTIQTHVKVINDFVRYMGYENLCIPRPLRNDLRGKTFGYITALEPTSKKRRRDTIWRCVCKCGKEIEVASSLLTQGNTTSCGCLNIEILQFQNRYVEGTSLRQALENRPISDRARSGYTGVQFRRGKWNATITYKGKKYYLGTYDEIEEAVNARARAKELVMEDAARLYDKYAFLYGEKPCRVKNTAVSNTNLEK